MRTETCPIIFSFLNLNENRLTAVSSQSGGWNCVGGHMGGRGNGKVPSIPAHKATVFCQVSKTQQSEIQTSTATWHATHSFPINVYATSTFFEFLSNKCYLEYDNFMVCNRDVKLLFWLLTEMLISTLVSDILHQFHLIVHRSTSNTSFNFSNTSFNF